MRIVVGRLFAAVFALLVAAGPTHAAIIEFTFTGSASGYTVDSNNGISNFPDPTPPLVLPFEIKAIGNTDNPQTLTDFDSGNPIGLFIENTSASIEIFGFGKFTFVTATRTYFNDSGQGIVGFALLPEVGQPGIDFFLLPLSPPWDMVTSIGPVPSSFGEIPFIDVLVSNGPPPEFERFSSWDFADVMTKDENGVDQRLVLNFADNIPASFQAVVDGQTPLPGALPLFASGLGAISFAAAWRRKRKAAAHATAA